MGRWWRYKWITFHPSLTGWLPVFHTAHFQGHDLSEIFFLPIAMIAP
ncbi:nonribosomal peptide synthetase [Yersinia pestis biovar Antiqua str. UG05-0454]|nr:nonribosomal peptide synthetase [Yersinia pestis biovar Antiqua str. UG05-0454]